MLLEPLAQLTVLNSNLAEMAAWALIGWQRRLPGSLCISTQKYLQYCHLHLLSCNFCFLLLSNVWDLLQKSISLVDQKGLGLWRQWGSYRTCAKWFLFVQAELKDTRLTQCPFGYSHPQEVEVFLHIQEAAVVPCAGTEKKKGADTLPFTSPDFFLHGHMLGLYIHSWKALLHHPTLQFFPTEINEECCSGYSWSREQWGTSETNPLGTLKQIKKPASLSASATTGCWYKSWYP